MAPQSRGDERTPPNGDTAGGAQSAGAGGGTGAGTGTGRGTRAGVAKTSGSSAGANRRRAPRGTISRPQIIDAALTSVTTTGFEQLTIRSLAAELGVAPMSLYRYIRDKDDLMDEVVDELLWRSQPIPPRTGTWQARITAAADGLRNLLVSEPAALYVYLRHPVVSPAAIRRMEMMLQILRTAGFDEGPSRDAYAAIQTYTIGFAALAASRAGWAPKDDAGQVANELAAFTTPKQFASGLRYLLVGIEHQGIASAPST
jgi:TetR/AcrR family transcriptional regulator, tetracycline repressor protein